VAHTKIASCSGTGDSAAVGCIPVPAARHRRSHVRRLRAERTWSAASRRLSIEAGVNVVSAAQRSLVRNENNSSSIAARPTRRGAQEMRSPFHGRASRTASSRASTGGPSPVMMTANVRSLQSGVGQMEGYERLPSIPPDLIHTVCRVAGGAPVPDSRAVELRSSGLRTGWDLDLGRHDQAVGGSRLGKNG
jgi:hypothetical protein